MAQEKITDDIFQAYLHCRHKSYLMLQGQDGRKSDYGKMQDRRLREFQCEARMGLSSEYQQTDILSVPLATIEQLSLGRPLVLDSLIGSGDLVSHPDALERRRGDSALGSFHYEPVIFLPYQTLVRTHRLVLGLGAVVLSRTQGASPKYGRIIHGDDFSSTRVHLGSYLAAASAAIDDLRSLRTETSEVPYSLNSHCWSLSFRACQGTSMRETDVAAGSVVIARNQRPPVRLWNVGAGARRWTACSTALRSIACARPRRNSTRSFRAVKSLALGTEANGEAGGIWDGVCRQTEL